MREELKQTGKRFGLGTLNLVLGLALAFGAMAVLRHRVPDLAAQTILTGLVFAVYLAGGRWIERRQIKEFQGRGGFGEFFGGLGLGIGVFSAVMAVLWMLGVYHPGGWGTAAGLGAGVLYAMNAGVLEETLVRGFLFRLISMVGGTWSALVVTAALFGALHAGNPGASLASSAAIAVEAGLLLGVAYALTGRLWFAIGLHAGWNFAEGSIYGMSVSGFEATPALFTGSLHGRTVLTGGAFGPEASVVAVVLCVATAAVLGRRMVRAGRVERPCWR
jgi:CAAX protease family protein